MIYAKNLLKSFGDREVLRSVSLSVAQGESLTLLGPSGSGKSTLLRCLNALETPDSGSVHVDEISLTTPLQAARLGIGMVFQHFNLFPHMTILQNITLSLRQVFQKTSRQAEKEAKHALNEVGLSRESHQYPHALSGGQKQRVAIARALALHPKIILFDEPTSALDPENVGEVVRVIESLKGKGITMVFVTHQMAFARRISDHILFMNQGKALFTAKTEEFFQNPPHKRAQQFLKQIAEFG